LPGENRFVGVPGADHFFAGKLDHLNKAITEWLTTRHPDFNG
jgi:alpha/beta superfamily hydrolase